MTVAHILNSYLPQTQTFIWQYLRAPRRTRFMVFCRKTENLQQFRLKNLRILKLEGTRWSRQWIADQLYFRWTGKKQNVLRRAITKHNVGLLHAHFGWSAVRYISLAIDEGIPLVTSFYGADISNRKRLEKLRPRYEQLFGVGARFLVEGPSMRQKLENLGCDSNRIRIQRISIDVSRYHFRVREWRFGKTLKLLFVGRLVEKKGLQYGLEALAKIKNAVSFQLKVIGNGPLLEDLQKMARKLGIEEEVQWLGQCSHAEVLNELDSCDVILQPSVIAKNGDNEGGAPTILIEAQACGVPVLSSDHADIPYVTRPSKSSFLARERDAQNLSDLLLEFISDPDGWETAARSGRAHVEQMFDIKNEIHNLEQMYLGLSGNIEGRGESQTEENDKWMY